MKIGLLGHGVVGSGVRKIIDEKLTDETKNLEITRILVKDTSEITDVRMTTDVNDILLDPSIDVVVECMGGIEPARKYALEALEHGKHFVTSNKKMFASSILELQECAERNHVSLHYEATCGGGIPWIANIDRCKRVDAIDSFKGIFNGTTNYILSRMYHENHDFASMLKEAQDLGYAEKDPTDDIDGYDIRYKTMISILKAFGKRVNLEDIPMFGIRYIDASDLKYCKENGYVVKMIGRAERNGDVVSSSVMPMFVKKDDVFASIPLNFNAIASNSKTLGKAVYIGQGAGSLPTAHAVVQDIIDIEKSQSMEMKFEDGMINNENVEGIYYIRSKNMEVFQDIMDGEVTKKVRLLEVLDRMKKANDKEAFIAEVEA